MNRAEVTAQLEHMKALHEKGIADALASLAKGDDNHNVAILEAVAYNKRFLDLIAVAAEYIDKVDEPTPAPAPAPPKRPSVGAVLLGGLHRSKPQ